MLQLKGSDVEKNQEKVKMLYKSKAEKKRSKSSFEAINI